MARSFVNGGGANNTDNQIAIADNLAGPPFTVSFWMKTSVVIPPVSCSTTGMLAIGGTILMGYQSGTGVTVFQFGDAFGNPSTLNMRGTSNITDANWHNLVFVGTNTSTCFIYVNGILEASQNSTGYPSASRGDTLWPNSPGAQFTSNFNGILAEYALWQPTTLNSSEIRQLGLGVLPCFIRPTSLRQYIPTYGVAGLGGGEAQYGTSHIVPTVKTSTYSSHPPVSQLDVGFPGTIGFIQLPEQWTGTWAQASFINSPPAGFSDWSPPSA